LRVVSGVLEETSLGVAKNAAAPEAAPAAAAGSIYEIVSRGNDFGLYDIERTRRTAVPALVNTLPVLSSGAETQYELTTLNFSIPAQAVPSAPGWIYDASNSLNQFGVYDSRVRTRKAKAQEVGWTPMEVLPEGGAVYETNLLNQEGVSTLPGNSARSLYQRSVRLNEFSLYDERVEHRQTVSQAFGPFLTARRTGQAEYMYLYENVDDVPQVPDGRDGAARPTRNTADGTWNGEVVVRSGAGEASVDWWGGNGETKYHFVQTLGDEMYDCYVYDRFTMAMSVAEEHMADLLVSGGMRIGQIGGHQTDIVPIGQKRLRARRVEVKEKTS